MEISFSFNEAHAPVTINVPANVGFTINVKPVAGHVPPVGGGGGGLNVNVLPPAGGGGGGVEQVVKANPKVFFYLAVDGRLAGRIVIELFADTTPRTAENFRALCTGEKGMGKLGKPLHYKGSIFHRLVPYQMFCGGDITAGNGSGGECIYEDRFFEDENFIRQHTGPGFISMENRGPDTNESGFLIGLQEDSLLGRETVAFGQVVQGLTLLNALSRELGNRNNKPSKPLVIADCGQIS
ncbi:hypothetical protein ARALYDRAFT_898595 [Arabidopsis lyrata subsp. lyrata]|uniref:Peptidyl-prolyl cis-trans isomerase n=1 Tax=Arabidopsis lyrata subsp. lyrata TaxID=81972 RepID=D7L0T3_ARALL|nr:peptidyl-prolyl cis-trans isomerase [Arabidopsis lyrata subsp. lyrata]XP_020882734.1 peptidyl-prolyl cis-trans isomerase [Arabidopsis lyrata subsp. lyrata]EFH61701.1 hypothetical protein ARALYDRAFT_898595 [Arabidopsis lyrata subsp. lyrata]|eukprot:XP_002885442.1 peptidyl-prolyl cis-trans isomerase [Arabidopsis lyrata subsp. lyrata]